MCALGKVYVVPISVHHSHRLNAQHLLDKKYICDGRLIYDGSIQLRADAMILDAGTGTGALRLIPQNFCCC